MEYSTFDVYEMVASGRMSYDEFEEWVSDRAFDAYREGSDNANYVAATNY